MSDLGPIIEQGGPMGRIRPGTRIAVRSATIEEYAHQVKQIEKNYLGRDSDIEACQVACKWLVVWADEPTQVLMVWFSPVGGVTKEYADEQAQKYARARGAKVVEL